jgi:alginate O-acetyltransferase complex protein AlgI
LLIASLIFYGWGGVGLLPLLIGSVIINYFFGLLIHNSKTKKAQKTSLGLGLFVNVSLLVYFKYTNFFLLNLTKAGLLSGEFPKIALPIGISFFTFHAMSYLIDIYRDQAHTQKNFAKLMLYLTLFPQLIAGPIIRYKDVEKQIDSRSMRVEKFASGIRRFMIGLMRKVIIANPMAVIADHAFNAAPETLPVSLAWLGVVAYTIQIYFDFAGYSDMAIGLGRMFGFEFFENFNFPYIAQSIKEFWRRWHISLSTWFRDYLYIPLGGNRKGKIRTYFNLITVFFLTGLWHGAAWNFVVWGLIHGFFLTIERLGFDKLLSRLPKFMQHLYTLTVVMFAWIFFRADSFHHAIAYMKVMFGLVNNEFAFDSVFEFIHLDTAFILIIALLGSTPFFGYLISKWKSFNHSGGGLIPALSLHGYHIAEIIFIFGGLLYSTMMLITNSYNPFIYFRF